MDYLETVNLWELMIENVGTFVVLGFGLAIFIGLLMWGVSLVVDFFRNMIRVHKR